MVLTMYVAAEDGPEADERVLGIAIEESLTAAGLGYNPWYTEHHFRGPWHSNPMQFAAYIAPQIPSDRYLGFGVLCHGRRKWCWVCPRVVAEPGRGHNYSIAMPRTRSSASGPSSAAMYMVSTIVEKIPSVTPPPRHLPRAGAAGPTPRERAGAAWGYEREFTAGNGMTGLPSATLDG